MKQKLLALGIVALLVAGGLVFLRSTGAQSPFSFSGSSSKTFDKTTHSQTDPSSPWVVVNKQRPLNPKNYAPTDLVGVGGGFNMRAEAAGALSVLIDDARKAGLELEPASGYRSYDLQVIAYNSEVDVNGRAIADTQSARPGYSEHQTGLSIDLAGGGCNIEDCFADTAQGKWAAANAYKYGYILRYPQGKEAVTGYRFEPWHFRYVGRDLSTELHASGVQTLEEFFELPAAPNY